MGNSLSQYWSEPTYRICMIGPDAAGKTTITYKLHPEPFDSDRIIGFAVEKVKYKQLEINVWDTGGQERIRPLWKKYYETTAGIVFVVDSSDTTRLDEAREQLHYELSEPELANARVLVYANKQDMKGALSAAEVGKRLDVASLSQECHVQASCARAECEKKGVSEGDGLHEGMDWLICALGR